MSFIMSLFKPLAYLSVPFLFLRSLSNASPIARYYIRAASYSGTLVTVASSCFFAAMGYSMAGKQYDVNNFVAKVFYATASRLFNLHVEVEGEENLELRPGVLMVNHQSMLDVLIIGRLMPRRTSIIAKESLKYTPLGPFMTMAGTVFLNRGNNVAAIESLNNAGNRIKKEKISTWIFPEGTRHLSATSDLLPLKKGGFHLAIRSGIPIIPIVVENYYHLYHHGVFGEGVIRVKVLSPIPTIGLTVADVGDLAIRVREQMLQALHEISTHATGLNAEKAQISQQDDAQQPVAQAAPVAEEPPSRVATPSSPFSQTSLAVSSSTASIASSVSSYSKSRASENGADTEEDEGMIIVGRPSN